MGPFGRRHWVWVRLHRRFRRDEVAFGDEVEVGARALLRLRLELRRD